MILPLFNFNMSMLWNTKERFDEDLILVRFFNNDNEPEEPELYNLFKSLSEINVSSVARRKGIPQSVMASYLCSAKKHRKVEKQKSKKHLIRLDENY